MKSEAIRRPKRQPTTALATVLACDTGPKVQDEARPGDARRDLMAGAPRGDGPAMLVTALPKARTICAPLGDRHQIRLVVWIEAPQLLVSPMTLDAPCRRWRFFLDLSSCYQVAIHIWRRFDPPLPIYDCTGKAAKTHAFREQDQALERSKSARRRR